MKEKSPFEHTRKSANPHFTTRRGFITGVGFGVVGLYGIWAAYGAAPTSFGSMSEDLEAGMAGMAHGREGEGMAGISPEKFSRLTMEFVDANSMPDGSVKPSHEGLKGRRSARKDAPSPGPHEARLTAAKDHSDAAEFIEIYMMCARYGYTPSHLRLEAGVPYKFKIMAMDVPHGFTINFHTASLVLRAPKKRMIEKTLVFTEPGEYLTYCSTYCGAFHHVMKGKIVVA